MTAQLKAMEQGGMKQRTLLSFPPAQSPSNDSPIQQQVES
jgi:hypothetical protein